MSFPTSTLVPITSPVPNNITAVRFGPIETNLVTDTNLVLGTLALDEQIFIPDYATVVCLVTNGTPTQQPVVAINDGTAAQNLLTDPVTLTSEFKNQQIRLTVPTTGGGGYVINGNTYNAVTNPTGQYINFNVATPFIGQATTNRASSGNNIATVTTSAAHGLVAGASTNVASLGNAAYNGVVTVISVPTTTTFTYYISAVITENVADTAGRVGTYQANVYLFGTLMGY